LATLHRLSLTPDRQCMPHLGFFFILPSLCGEVEDGWALCPFTSNCCLNLHKISNITDQLKSLSGRQYRQLQQAYTMNDSRSSQLFALPIDITVMLPTALAGKVMRSVVSAYIHRSVFTSSLNKLTSGIAFLHVYRSWP